MTPVDPPRWVFVVRRGALERLQLLQAKFEGQPIGMVVDRRGEDRRWRQTTWSVERRLRSRRVPWAARFPSSGFVVVPATLTDDWVAPALGDALVTRLDAPPATEGYGISLIPGGTQSRYDTYDLAAERARQFARYAAADLWYTEDGLTFVLLEIFRTPPRRGRVAR